MLLALVSQFTLAQSDFITRWDLSTAGSGATQLSFGVATTGSVNYTWAEVSPGTATGSGVFNGATATIKGLPAGATIDLRISPTNFQRFIMSNGSDRNRLIDIRQWGTTGWTSMQNAFYGCSKLQVSATDVPNLAGVDEMSLMFRECTVLNGPANIGTWNTENVMSMFGLFNGARAFNQPIGDWNTQNVIYMDGMFLNAHAFNQPIGNWNTQNVKSMPSMFAEARVFNQPIGNWNIQNVTSLVNTFGNATAFDQALGNWTLNPSVSLTSVFFGSALSCYNYSETLKGWSANPATPNGRDLGFAIAHGVTYSPSAAAARNNLINNKGWYFWGDTQSSTECLGAASYFKTRWNLSTAGSGATQLSFAVATSGEVNYTWTEVSPGTATGSGTFNGSNATITGLPAGATIELQISPVNFQRIIINDGTDKDRLVNIRQWGTTTWSSMADAFRGCTNLQIGASDIPDMSLVTDMSAMFKGCTILNGPINIGNWNTQNVTNMSSTFEGASAFDKNIGNWNTRNVVGMSNLFNGATAFDQPLGNWTLNAAVSLASIFENSGLSCYSYSETLKGWSANAATPDGLNLQADGRSYSTSAESARTNLINKGWTIGGDAPSGAECPPPLSVTQFVTRWNLSTTGSAATQLSFGVATSGSVSYNWTEISPGGATGSGTFDGSTATISDLPAGATIELRIAPTHFERFIINNGADKNRLTDVSQWGATHWSSMAEAFYGCAKLKISATDIPDLSIVTDMGSMFNGCTTLNSPLNINSWNTQSVVNMSGMFRGASTFNQPIGNWNTGNVTSFYKMFEGASAFNQPIASWVTQSVTNMGEMFFGAGGFNQNIGGWNTGNVTNMNGMFRKASAFNQAIGAWNTSNVVDMAFLFREAIVFNQSINNWNTQKVTAVNGMFQNAVAFNQPIDSWNTANVVNMSEMFRSATGFNRAISNWNTQKVTAMNGMFRDAGAFNQSIANWNIQSVTDMTSMFQGAGSFNQSLGNWTLNASVTLTSVFTNSGLSCNSYSATLIGWAANTATPSGLTLEVNGRRYNPGAEGARNDLITAKGWTIEGDIAVDTDCTTPLTITHFVTRWDLSTAGTGDSQLSFGVTTSGPVSYTWTEVSPGTASGSGTFNGSTATITGLPTGAIIELRISPTNFQRIRISNGVDRNRLVDVSQWGRTVWVSMNNAFAFCGKLQISATDVPNLSLVTDLSTMFVGCDVLNGPTNINSWNTQKVTSMAGMFRSAIAFNQPIGNWDTRNVTDMSGMFREARVFNQPIGNWNTQNVTDMGQMFLNADVFNQPIGNWNTQNVSSMLTMFNGALAFNQPIGNWNTQNVTTMSSMFADARAFNQPIGTWNTQKVTAMVGMFRNAIAFNQPIGNWNVQLVANLNSMFNGASAFDQSLGNWTLNASQGLTAIFTNSGLSCYTYSETLKGWGTNAATPNLLNLDADGRTYSPSAAAARNNLIASKGWTITGDAPSGTECLAPVSADQFITRWNLSTTGSGATQLSFGVATSGSVSYVWTEVTPGGGRTTASSSTMVSGVGTFSGATASITDLPAGATIELRILPNNFRGIAINNGADKNRLTDIKQWGTTAWSSLAAGFYGCSKLQISATDVPNLLGVTDLSAMFKECTALNSPANIGSWNTQEVTTMEEMFKGATAFNQLIGNWNVQKVVNMNSMFMDAATFNQSLGNWSLNPFAIVTLTSFLTNSGLDCYYYSETLKGWAGKNPISPAVTLDAGTRKYSPSAKNARNFLVDDMDGWAWTIIDGGESPTECRDPLPVSLVSFSGQRNNENQNVLKWATADERNFDRFEIQRSSNAVLFQTIAEVPGQRERYDPSGGSAHNQLLSRYTFTDPAPVSAHYYRLRMVDRDDSFEYSRIIFIDNQAAKPLIGPFYPNPSSGKVLVDVDALESGRWILTVVDASGKGIETRTYDLKKGKNTISLENFAPGINVVHFESGKFLQVRKLVRE